MTSACLLILGGLGRWALEMAANESVGKRAHLLPEDTLYIRIEGGDHHQFGSYQIDPGDHLATISRTSQHQQIVQATLKLLSEIKD